MSKGTGHALPDYGLDAPYVIRNFLLASAAGIALFVSAQVTDVVPLGLASAGVWTAGFCLLSAGWFWWSSRHGKLRARDKLLDKLGLKGEEAVLDVGCGHGLLLIGAAKRVPHGRAVGIDLWSQTDQGDNSKEATLANARAEGVEGRVEVQDGDMRELPFPDATFDVAVASLSIHNIPDREGRKKAIAEVVRVLKPGGRAALLDFKYVGEYALDLKAQGMTEVVVLGPGAILFPPTKVAWGKKPAASSPG